MTSGVYYRTKKHRKNLSLANIGRAHSEIWNKRISEAMNGRKPSKKAFENSRFSRLGKPLSKITKLKISLAGKGRKVSEETREKIRNANLLHKSHFWKGGISFKKYTTDWNRKLRESIRKRDDYTCQICHKDNKNSMIYEKLSVHHIDYNKKNCSLNNLISLCRICHRKTDFNKTKWIKYFNKLRKINSQQVKWEIIGIPTSSPTSVAKNVN